MDVEQMVFQLTRLSAEENPQQGAVVTRPNIRVLDPYGTQDIHTHPAQGTLVDKKIGKKFVVCFFKEVIANNGQHIDR